MTNEFVEKMALQAYNLSQIQHRDFLYYLYDRTNENLTEFFKIYQSFIYNKDVLSVLASSDQLLSCKLLKCRSVDAFDRVYISLYYYYLRKWLILHNNSFYPSYKFFYDGDKELYELILSINPESRDEEEAQLFWKKYMEYNNYKTDDYLFCIAVCDQPKPFDRKINIVKTFFDNPLRFYCFDIFSKVPINKRYDVIILSNMLEYHKNNEQLIMARDNIESLLKDDGLVLCSYKIYDHNSKEHLEEVDILTSNRLDLFYENHVYYEPLIGGNKDLAYSYKLKKK